MSQEHRENPPRVLLVEDEEHLLETITLNLELEGMEVIRAVEGKQALKYFHSARYDLIILDVMLPEIDGFTLCRTMRKENPLVPILMLTAKGSNQDRVEGLKLGADDYLTKPFHLEEFLLRVHGLIRRGRQQSPSPSIEQYRFGTNQVDFRSYRVTCADGTEQTLTKKEVQLLKLLIEMENQVVSRDAILELVWGYEIYPTARTIDNFILNFRKYFEPNPKQPIYFHSIRGVGYKFVKNGGI
jgi:two-component system alkaline phosphatase synthesis response regulator PhoP